MDRYRKYCVAIFVLAVLMFPMAFAGEMRVVAAVEDPTWYANRAGVLHTEKTLVDPDTTLPEGLGVLYPFETDASLNIGFSKFGEMIDGVNNIGMNYRGRDVFCRTGLIDKWNWLNGWYIEIKYKTTIYTPGDRFIWAFALFADYLVWGGDWKTVSGSNGGAPPIEKAKSGTGGRQTNTYCFSDPIRTLYNGPRRSVDLLVTHIYDADIDPATGTITNSWPVLDVMFTIIFNKDKKEIIILKDLCYRLKIGKEYPPIDVKFSNREQVDAGPDADPAKSYAHFWHQKFSTCYGGNWLNTKWILRENDETITVKDPGYASGDMIDLECVLKTGLPAVRGSEKVWIDTVLQVQGLDYDFVSGTVSPDPDFTWDQYWEGYGFVKIKWLKPVPAKAVVEIQYKNIMKELLKPKYLDKAAFPTEVLHVETAESHRYDLAQFISADKLADGTPAPKYVVFKAYWPTLSSYTLSGWNDKFLTIHYPPLDKTLTPHWCDDLDMPTEPGIPFSIGQWDFLLSNEPKWTQFRAVEVLGMVDYHDADDNGFDLNGDLQTTPQIDTEVYWQLQEVFNPWDLNDATSLTRRRVVEFFTYTKDVSSVTLQLTPAPITDYRDVDDSINHVGLGKAINPKFKYGDYDYWYRYCTFGEKVLIDGVLKKPKDAKGVGDYTLPAGSKTLTISLKAGKVLKVLYSVAGGVSPFSDPSIDVLGWKGNYEWIVVGRDSKAVDSAGSGLVTELFKNKQIPVLWSGLDMQSTADGPTVPYVLVKLSDTYKATDGRITLKDDWCKTVPVKSSSIITVGGMGVNTLTSYYNDFTNAYIEGTNVRALTCWSKNKIAYSGITDNIGYGVISTYKDIDGTVGFVIYGLTGEDTYWACWWLWHFGWKLQKEPDCVTDIIIKFDYTRLYPSTFSHDTVKYKPLLCFWEVVEALGTISEFDFTDTRLVFTFTGSGTEFSFIETRPDLLSPSYTTDVNLYGCWVWPDWVTRMPPLTGPNFDLGHWSASPFWMVKDTAGTYKTTAVSPVTATFDFTKGTVTFSASQTNPRVLFQVKQPPHHKCNTLNNV